MIKFIELIDSLPYPAALRGRLSTQHAKIVDYALANYNDTRKFKHRIIDAINILTRAAMVGDFMPEDWSIDAPLDNLPEFDPELLRRDTKKMYLDYSTVMWDIPAVASEEYKAEVKKSVSSFEIEHPRDESAKQADADKIARLTDPEDLELTGPKIPLFDTSKVLISGELFDKTYCIYYSLPRIPTRQCEISVTTNPKDLSDNDVLQLYPNRVLYTRHEHMYANIPDMKSHPLLGNILPIEGFTEEQVIDNIIQYPHLDYLTRQGRQNNQVVFVDFWRKIEIDGKLYTTYDIWDSLPDIGKFPKYKGLVYEYVVRRYLLERDVKHIDHKYKLFGDLSPFLTLFMPTKEYIDLGYTEVLDIGQQCVRSRIAFLRSRNPIIRRLEAGE